MILSHRLNLFNLIEINRKRSVFSNGKRNGFTMKIVIDESVSFGVALYLREIGYDVIAISERQTSGL